MYRPIISCTISIGISWKFIAWVKHAPILLIFLGASSPYPRTILQEFQIDPRKKVFFDTPYCTSIRFHNRSFGSIIAYRHPKTCPKVTRWHEIKVFLSFLIPTIESSSLSPNIQKNKNISVFLYFTRRPTCKEITFSPNFAIQSGL